MAESDIKGHVRPRGTKLEAVIWVDGRRVTRSTGFDIGQEAEAEKVLEAALAELRSTADAPAARIDTVRGWGEHWIEDRKARQKLEWVHERSHLEYFLYPELGNLLLTDVTDVRMLDWARGLERDKGPSGKPPGPKYIRKITATVRAVFKEAVRRHLIERTPCVWEDSDLPELEANSRVMGGGFELEQVRALIYDPRIPEDRRVLYALELLTGQRSGEAAARTWADWEPVFLGRLGRLVIGTAYNTRFRLLKTTKTRVEKWVPVHPALAEILQRWKEEGWERFYGRAPMPEDLIVPAVRGGPRNVSHTWRCFRNDLVTLGIPHQRHYETRATFISLAEGAGADPATIARLTHASLNGAKDLYRRVRLYWPRMCEAVLCIPLSGAPPEVSQSVSQPASEPVAESGDSLALTAAWAETGIGGRARESNAGSNTLLGRESTGLDPVSPGSLPPSRRESPGSALPDATPEFVAAAGRLAAAAVTRGDRAEARRLLEAALRCVEQASAPRLRIVGDEE